MLIKASATDTEMLDRVLQEPFSVAKGSGVLCTQCNYQANC